MKELIVKLLPERFVWFLSGLLYKIGYRKPFLWDIARSERIVEYSWVLKNIGIEKGNVLDVGCSGTFFPLALSSLGLNVYGVDKKQDKIAHPNFKFIQADILDSSTELPKNYFDVITLISTVEHIGLEDDGDFKCMEQLCGLLKDDGRIIVTAPFGKAATFTGYRVYDMERIKRLWQGKIDKIHFFIRVKKGIWVRCSEAEVSKVEMESKGECKGIFCAVLKK